MVLSFQIHLHSNNSDCDTNYNFDLAYTSKGNEWFPSWKNKSSVPYSNWETEVSFYQNSPALCYLLYMQVATFHKCFDTILISSAPPACGFWSLSHIFHDYLEFYASCLLFFPYFCWIILCLYLWQDRTILSLLGSCVASEWAWVWQCETL